MKARLILCLLLVMSMDCLAQNETETHVFWQPGAKLSYDMFQGAPSDTVSAVQKLRGWNINFEVYLGFWHAVDIPRSMKDRNKMPEKYYFCAAMEKGRSVLLVRDSTELKYCQMLWDICELATRVARERLEHYVGLKRAASRKKDKYVVCRECMTAVNDGKEYGRDMTRMFFSEVARPRNEEAYRIMRARVDSLLTEYKDYATTEEEIRRLSTGQPDKKYMEVKPMEDSKGRGNIRF